jgi:hypothetical protein
MNEKPPFLHPRCCCYYTIPKDAKPSKRDGSHFHGGNTGSNPVGDANTALIQENIITFPKVHFPSSPTDDFVLYRMSDFTQAMHHAFAN